MAELIWECLIISIILLLGINIGLAMGLKQVPKEKVLSISMLYGAILFTLGVIANYATPLYDVINEYIPLLMGIIGIVIILSGIYTIIDWKRDKGRNHPFASTATLSSSLCCFAGVIFTSILLYKDLEVNFLLISIMIAVPSIVLIMVFYLFSNFLRHAERPYPVILGNFMILNGFYFLIAALFIPSIKSMVSIQTSPLSIGASTNMVFLIMAGAGVFLIGVYLAREGISSLEDIYQRKPFKKLKK